MGYVGGIPGRLVGDLTHHLVADRLRSRCVAVVRF